MQDIPKVSQEVLGAIIRDALLQAAPKVTDAVVTKLNDQLVMVKRSTLDELQQTARELQDVKTARAGLELTLLVQIGKRRWSALTPDEQKRVEDTLGWYRI